MLENQKYLNRILALGDIVVIAVSFALSWYLRFRSPFIRNRYEILGQNTYIAALFIIVIVMVLCYAAFGLYAKNITRTRTDVANILKANIVGALVIIVLLFVIKIVHFSRVMLFLFFVINVFLELMERMLVRSILRKFWINEKYCKNVLLIGYSRAAEEYLDRVLKNPQWGYVVRGILDDRVKAGTEYKGIKVIGRIDNLDIILPQHHLNDIVITLGLSEYYRLEKIVKLCEKSGVHTKFVPDYNNMIPTKPYTEDLLGLPVINIRYVPLSNTFLSLVKRMVDIFISAVAIIVSSPVMLAAIIAIKKTSPGPILFKQERVGLNNKKFMMYKFRSMVIQDAEKEKKAWTTPDDPRVTKVGKFLRKTSIDELPQLFNIIKGDMSVVGPRPERPYFVEKFQEEIPRYNIKHQVRPGLTGWAQIHGYRGDTSIKKRIEYDLYYIENWTLWLDIKIIFLTFFSGFVNKNAY
ncbi:MAG: undecaprenyl-phosphate glucose phosphotransferase [Lachnospiraceae bacterium]|jgi:Undecaprenyl-phosphate glucose phosphotransferase